MLDTTKVPTDEEETDIILRLLPSEAVVLHQCLTAIGDSELPELTFGQCNRLFTVLTVLTYQLNPPN